MKRLCLIFFVFLHSLLPAQQAGIVFNRLTKENGLASSRVNAILKDHKGFYWLSTINGLQRFDGTRMITFQHDAADSASLLNNEMGFILLEDRNHRLWMHTESGVCVYNPLKRNFTKINFRRSAEEAFGINSFFEDSHGQIWMAVQGDDLYLFDPVKNNFRSYTTAWPRCAEPITSITEDKESRYYWLTTPGGLAVYDADRKEYYTQSHNPKKLACFDPAAGISGIVFIYKDNKNILWIRAKQRGQDDAILRYDIRGNELASVKTSGNNFGGFLTDASGTTWAFGNSLARYDKQANRFFEIPRKREGLHGIDFNEIQNMYEDADGNIWFMTDMGLYNCNPHQQIFTTRNIVPGKKDSTADARINGFIETSDGGIIALGRGGEGLYFFDASLNPAGYRYGFLPSKFSDKNYLYAWCGMQDSRGVIWVGCEAGRLFQMNPATNAITTLHPPELEDQTIRSMAEDKNGNIWMGTNNNIIVKWTRSTGHFTQLDYTGKGKSRPEWVLRILPGHENDLWVATTGAGLLRVDLATDKIAEQFLPGNNPGDIASYYVVDIAALNANTYVLATESGVELFDWRRKNFSHIGERDGLPSTGIYSMMKDDKENLWFTSVDGISKIHLPDKRIKEFSSRDGITSEDFQTESEYKYANVIRLKSNIILFGNPRGFISFNPADIDETVVPADVSITGFRIFDKSLSVDSLFLGGDKVSLKYFQNYIDIQFASLGNTLYNRPVYYYKLEGIDRDWVRAGSGQEAIYTYLPGGHYTFRVKCISPDGVESKHITSFRIHIQPPLYLRWWFILLSFGIVGWVLYYIYLLRVRRRMERELIRNRIARDLHDDMGSTLSTINILSSMAKTKIGEDPQTTGQYISKISDNSQRMMDAMSDIVWAIKPDNDSMQKITARMQEFAGGILEAKNIALDFEVGENVNTIKLNMEARRDFFLIFKEAVNNVAKYSHCAQCRIHVSVHQKRLLLLVEDNGVGFDVNQAGSGNGLSNMQKRADAMKGRVSVQSKPGEGTKVILNIPAQ